MMKLIRGGFALLGIAIACLLGTGAASAASPYNCAGGVIPPGVYSSLTVTGTCTLSNRAVDTTTVQGGVSIAHGAALNAITESRLLVGSNIVVNGDGALGLGCSPAAGCVVTTSDRVGGSILATNPLALIVHSTWIGGGVRSQGGGGGVTCDPRLFGGPAFSTFEDNTIGAGISFMGYQSCWLGFFRNTVTGSVTIEHNTLADPDAVEVATNTISGNLSCFDNIPHAQVGDSGGGPNTVAGSKLGECAGL
jgi:hypothetical protein